MEKLSTEKLLAALNQARTDPKSLIPYLEKTLAKFKKEEKKYEFSRGRFIITHEGKSVFKETIEYLQNVKPLGKLSYHDGLGKSAQKHATDLGVNQMTGHVGSNGSTMEKRICEFSIHDRSGYIGENVAQQFKYKERDHELQAVLALIVDDGVSNRGHRNSIFSVKYNYCGIGFGQTNKHYLVVINYSQKNLPLIKEGNKLQQQTKPKNVENPKTDIKDKTLKQHVNIPQKQVPNSDKQPKKIVKQKSQTSTEIINGKTTTVTKTKTEYSDGSSSILTKLS